MVSSAKIITNEVIEKVLRYNELIPAVESGLKAFSNKEVIQPLRSVLSIKEHNGFYTTMPAYLPNQNVLAIKCLGFYDDNPKKKIPALNAQIMLLNSSTGTLLALMDAELISGMRTAAASAVASQYLAKDDSTVLAILGSGVQGECHIFALSSIYSFEKVFIWNRTPENAEKLREKVKTLAKVVKTCSSPSEAVAEADIIVTATSTTDPILCGKWLKEGVHINCIGACRPNCRELDDECMELCDLFVDSRTAAYEESGDIIASKKKILGEIGELSSGKVKAEKNKRTLFKSLGIAVEDAVAADLVWKKVSV